jgi:hypothetical protein
MNRLSPVISRFPAEKILPQTPFILAAAVTEDGRHLYLLIHHHKSAGLGNDRFQWIKLYFYELHFFAIDLVVYFVCIHFDLFFSG